MSNFIDIGDTVVIRGRPRQKGKVINTYGNSPEGPLEYLVRFSGAGSDGYDAGWFSLDDVSKFVETVDTFKEKVREHTKKLMAEREWCTYGTNLVLEELGITPFEEKEALTLEITVISGGDATAYIVKDKITNALADMGVSVEFGGPRYKTVIE